MDITLYYVRGINETDTPVFDSLANQAAYFSDCERKVISTGFYPPYFQNTIKLDVSDMSLTSTFNYLSLSFGPTNSLKTYYYFIDDIRYINEDVVEIDISMDTIQTYMFDITWVYSHISRKSIKRWKNVGTQQLPVWQINRDYIRENYSSGLFNEVYTKQIVNTLKDEWFVIGRSTETSVIGRMFIESSDIGLGLWAYGKLLCQPVAGNGGTYRIMLSNTPTHYQDVTLDADGYWTHVLEESSTLDAYCIPFNPFSDLTITRTSGNPTMYTGEYVTLVDGTSTIQTFDVRSYTSTLPGNAIEIKGKVNVKVNSGNINLPVVRNTALSNTFTWMYVPGILDESYITYDFGSYNTRSKYPIQMLKTTKVYYQYWADVSSGTLYFNTSADGDSITSNKYATIVSSKAPLSIEIRNNAWNEYMARNKATLAGALLNSASAVASASLGFSDSARSSISDIDNVTKTTGRIGGKFAKVREFRSVGAHSSYLSSSGESKNNGISLSANPRSLIDYGVNALNQLGTPDSVKSSGSLLEDAFGYNANIYYQVILCSNIREAAYIYESTGYKVSEATTGNLLSTNNRFYFDCVQVDEMNIVMQNRELEDNIINRFKNGVRLWHTTNGVLNTKTVQGINFEMGQVCIYDNVEV